jgi:hypothetical protein
VVDRSTAGRARRAASIDHSNGPLAGEKDKKNRGVTMIFLEWHQRQTEQWIERLGITPYQALWWAWAKGVVLGAVGYWWLLG